MVRTAWYVQLYELHCVQTSPGVYTVTNALGHAYINSFWDRGILANIPIFCSQELDRLEDL